MEILTEENLVRQEKVPAIQELFNPLQGETQVSLLRILPPLRSLENWVCKKSVL